MPNLNKNNLFRLVFIALLLLIFTIGASAQRLYFNRVNPISKNNRAKIDHLAFDEQGFLWLGTDQGLFLTDGIFEKQYLPDSAKSSEIGYMAIDDNFIYSGWNDGTFAQFDLRKKEFTPIEKISNEAINKILIDDKNRVWISTRGEGIFLKTGSELKHYEFSDGLSDNNVNELAFNPTTGVLWAATDRGLSKLTSVGDSLLIENVSGLNGNIITAMTVDSMGTLWVGTYSGRIVGIKPVDETIYTISIPKYWNTGSITKLKVIGDDLWIGTKHGIGIFGISERRFRLSGGSEINEVIHDIVYDGQNRVLLSTGNSSLLSADIRFLFIEQYDGVPFKDAGVVLNDKNERILFSNEKGLYRFSPMFDGVLPVEKIFDLKANNVQYIISLYIDDSDRIWIGTFGQGLWMIDNKNRKHFTEKDGLINNNILSISGRGQEIWMGTLGGASMLKYSDDKATFVNYGVATGLTSQYVYSVYAAKDEVWLGTDGSGLINYKNGKFKTIVDNGYLDNIYSVTGSGNEIWFSSGQGYLNVLVGDSIISYPIKYNDRETEISTLVMVDDDHVFFLCENGIGMFSKQNHQYVIFNEEYGLEPFNYNYLNTLYGDKKGNVWAGTESFLLKMRMHDHEFSLVPKTYIRTVDLFSAPIDTTLHEFESSQNHFIFNYSGLWYHSPLKVRFKYRLKGFDIDWKETKDNTAIYQKLPPGHYVFEVGSSTTSNFDSVSFASYGFTIKKPIYFQWWFIIFSMVFIVFIIYLMMKFNEQKKIKKALIEREKILSQFELLKSQVNPHFLFNSLNTLNALIYKDKAEANEFLLRLSDYMRYLLTQNENTTHLLIEELKLASDYAFLQKKRFGNNLKIKIDLSDELQNNSLIPPLTIQILLENAIKHNIISGSKPLNIKIYREGETLVVLNNLQVIKDKIKSTGIGLSNIKNRYRILFDKEIEIVKNDKYFIVKLPLINKPYENFTY